MMGGFGVRTIGGNALVTENIDRRTLPNQKVWDKYPEKADEAALNAIATGGFSGDSILYRRTGDGQGQVLAIQRGWVDTGEYGSWTTNESGWQALEDAGRMLGGLDTWHNSRFKYIVQDVRTRSGTVGLRLFKEAYAAEGRLGMNPVLERQDVKDLQDFLTKWLADHEDDTEGQDPGGIDD